MRVLVLAGDPWHPADIVRVGLVGLRQFGFEFVWSEHAEDVDTARLGEYPIIVLAKANYTPAGRNASWLSEPMQHSFTDFVCGGGGLLALHSGAAVSADATALRRLLGGAFRGHPEPCPVRIEPLVPSALATGCDAFESVDEQYAMELDDEDAEIFLVTESDHGRQPAGWSRHKGDGRVCILTPGHKADVWSHASYQRLLLNVLRWTGEAKSKEARFSE